MICHSVESGKVDATVKPILYYYRIKSYLNLDQSLIMADLRYPCYPSKIGNYHHQSTNL